MAIGVGSFWFPQYSTLNIAGISSFHEQPPLVFGIQALFYKILGDSIYVERFYTLLTLLAHIILINVLWKLNFKRTEEQYHLGWIAVIFWILIPVCWWSFHNNLMENTMSLFDLAAVILIIKNISKPTVNYIQWIIAGVLIFMASFSKGLPGLFPLVVPMLFWIVYRESGFYKNLLLTLLLLGIPAFIYAILFIYPVSRESLSLYVFERLLVRVNSMPTSAYRLEIFWRLFTEFLPVLISLVIVFAIAYFRKAKLEIKENSKIATLYLLIGLSASTPLALTMVQKGWYLVPSFPYLAISAALLISQYISKSFAQKDLSARNYTVFTSAVSVFFVGVILVSATQWGKISREKDTLSDVYKIGEVVPRFSTVTVPENMYDEYNFILQGFLVRHFNISIDPTKEYEYFLNEKQNEAIIPAGYTRVEIPLRKYDLYIQN
jgi:4-amino-4-deoxy-L-arabinose transferase-like glycosyltransferase